MRGCGVPADRVGYLYATSPTMARFGCGDPSVVAGLSGRELGLALFREMRGADAEPPRPRRERTAAGKSPEWLAEPFLFHEGDVRETAGLKCLPLYMAAAL